MSVPGDTRNCVVLAMLYTVVFFLNHKYKAKIGDDQSLELESLEFFKAPPLVWEVIWI